MTDSRKLKIGPFEDPVPRNPREIHRPKDQKLFLGADIKKRFKKSAVMEVGLVRPQFFNKLFLRPKKKRIFQTIINLKNLKQFLPYQKCKDSISAGNLTVKVNLNDAYSVIHSA